MGEEGSDDPSMETVKMKCLDDKDILFCFGFFFVVGLFILVIDKMAQQSIVKRINSSFNSYSRRRSEFLPYRHA